MLKNPALMRTRNRYSRQLPLPMCAPAAVCATAWPTPPTHRIALLQVARLPPKHVLPQRGVHKLEHIQQPRLAPAAALSVAQHLQQPHAHTIAHFL